MAKKSAATPDKAPKETPLMKQYNEIKNKYPDACLLFRVGDFYETFGGGLGWFSIAVPWWIIITLFMCILMVTFSEEKNYSSNRIIKVGMLIIVAVSIALVCMALLLDWTPITTYTINGVQGRYFLPVLPLLFIGMQSDCIKIEKGLSYKAVFISILMQPFIIQTLIASS